MTGPELVPVVRLIVVVAVGGRGACQADSSRPACSSQATNLSLPLTIMIKCIEIG